MNEESRLVIKQLNKFGRVPQAHELLKMIEKLERQIDIKDRYCQLIIDLGFDYDGFNTVDNLKGLIDTLVDYAYKAKQNDDKTPAYVSGEEKSLNILMEEVSNE